jgi:hypothetical protein
MEVRSVLHQRSLLTDASVHSVHLFEQCETPIP